MNIMIENFLTTRVKIFVESAEKVCTRGENWERVVMKMVEDETETFFISILLEKKIQK